MSPIFTSSFCYLTNTRIEQAKSRQEVDKEMPKTSSTPPFSRKTVRKGDKITYA
ncbi:hypothetical protein GCM10011573_18520 [Enterococcus wangshanyuanii]|uniref:Uncharacterized protein n=1 Tax=Enterococcus wangshanyuanii TaxID=2005703 RepID=A0ABQ1P4X2_9ENTE|nr:hypothetical protein GCM10011573_18520 [Enterococcus wangshanyuanii]